MLPLAARELPARGDAPAKGVRPSGEEVAVRPQAERYGVVAQPGGDESRRYSFSLAATSVHPVPVSPAVGFDLDMTLADPRLGVVASWRALSEQTGVRIDAEAVAARLGPPVEVEVERWFPTKDVPAVTDLYRTLHQKHGVPATFLMPGALAACEAVVAAGSRVIVVTAKKPELAAAVVMRLGLPAEAVHGGLWGGAKGPCLREEGAAVYVGDHPQDLAAARVAGAFSVGVETGPEYPVGADVVLPSLEHFAEWYSGWLDHKP